MLDGVQLLRKLQARPGAVITHPLAAGTDV